MAPVGLDAAGELQLLGHGGAGRPHHQLATSAARPRRRPGDDVDPNRVDQDDAAQVQHDVMVALADQVAKALPQLRGGVRVEITAHGDDGRAVRGWWRTATEAPWRPPCLVSDVASWDTTGRSARRTAGESSVRQCGYRVAAGRTLAAWGPLGPCVMSNSTDWPSSSEPSPWMALTCTNTSLPDSGLMKP